MKQYKRPSKAQITALALGVLTIGSFGAGDVYANSTTELEWKNNSEYVRPISEASAANQNKRDNKNK